MSRRARAIAIARRRQPPSLLPWIMLALMLTAAVAAHAQGATSSAPSGGPNSQTTPPEIVKPGLGGPGGVAAPEHGANGVIAPPPSVDPGMPVARPDPGAFPTPMLQPPGTPGGDPNVVPK
jgi:hypothetical protein